MVLIVFYESTIYYDGTCTAKIVPPIKYKTAILNTTIN